MGGSGPLCYGIDQAWDFKAVKLALTKKREQEQMAREKEEREAENLKFEELAQLASPDEGEPSGVEAGVCVRA